MGILGKIFKGHESKEKAATKAVGVSDEGKKDAVKEPARKNKQSTSNEDKLPEKKSETKVPAKKSKKELKRIDVNAHKVISHPLISEKATDLAMVNKYVFIVPKDANKSEIAKTVQNVYGVTPIKVNIIKRQGKKVRYGRLKGKQKDFKKAVVTLNPEDKIEVYEGV